MSRATTSCRGEIEDFEQTDEYFGHFGGEDF